MVDALQVTDELSIPMEEIELSAIRSQGAGGQNVNKVASAIHLRFDITNSGSLPAYVRDRLLDSGDGRISASGVVVIKSQEHRTQSRNRDAALNRLKEIVLSALTVQKPRKTTKPSRRSRRKRVDDKRHRGEIKRSRGRIDGD